MRSAWNRLLGRKASRWLRLRMLPDLRWNQEVWGETVRDQMVRPLRWLDAGCGWRLLGEDLEALENELVKSTNSVVGVDLDLPHLQRHINIERRACASLASLPFRDNSFDLITCNMVAEHLPEPAPIFREVSRVLAPGGKFLVHTPNTRNYLVLANVLAKIALPRSLVLKLVNDGRETEDVYPTFYRANSEPALRELGKAVGLGTKNIKFLAQPQPYTRFFAPLAFFELLLMRATMARPLDRFAATIVVIFQKPEHPGGSVGSAA